VLLDGHNDLLLRLWRGEEPRHLDLDAARAAGFSGGFFAVFVPSPDLALDPPAIPYRLPLPEPIPQAAARETALALVEVLELLVEQGRLRLARSVDAFEPGEVTAILHLEGADPLASDLTDLDGTLTDLQARVSDRLAAAGVYTPETRPYRAHATVARLRPRARPPRAIDSDPDPIEFAGEALTLFESRLHPHGARYEPLVRLRLH